MGCSVAVFMVSTSDCLYHALRRGKYITLERENQFPFRNQRDGMGRKYGAWVRPVLATPMLGTIVLI